MNKIIRNGRAVAGKIRRSKYRKRAIRAYEGLLIFVLFIAVFSYLTNPFTRFSVVKNPFQINRSPTGQLVIIPLQKIYLVDNPLLTKLGELKATWHILSNTMLGGGNATKNTTLDGIIDDIHALRFNPKEPYIISGDHFSVLYPRSLGIFYNTLLDPRTARSSEDWINRQELYLKTTLYLLLSYKNANRLSTTVTPTGPESVTLNNYFDPPSDTLYSILYAIRRLQTSEDLLQYYPFPLTELPASPKTRDAANQILSEYMPMLKRHVDLYIRDTVDPDTGLVRTDRSFSGTKDSVIRYGAFYDNVVMWKTLQLAQQLRITPENNQSLDQLKQKIIETFWLPQEGYFLEDSTDLAKKEKHYSSDWLIALMTGFLSPQNKQEQEYFTRSIAYIRKEKLDAPFGLKYQSAAQKSILHLPLRLFAPTYGTQAIWSHWGMEFIKLLTSLYQQTCDEGYLDEAVSQVQSYTDRILKYRGYPELYDSNGNVFSNKFYKSVFQTGWVVNFELAKVMTEQTKIHKEDYCPTDSSDQHKTR